MSDASEESRQGGGPPQQPKGAEGGAIPKTRTPRPDEGSSNNPEGSQEENTKKRTTPKKGRKESFKENIPPLDVQNAANTGIEHGPFSHKGERKVLGEIKELVPLENKACALPKVLPAPEAKPEEKYFKLKTNVSTNITVTVTETAPIEQYVINIKGAVTTPRSNPMDSIQKFYQFFVVNSVSDLWAFDAFITQSGAFAICETEKTKVYKCHERVFLPDEDGIRVLKKKDLEECEDFFNTPTAVNERGGVVCNGYFKLQKTENKIFRFRNMSLVCDKCNLLVPKGLTPSFAMRYLRNILGIEPFTEVIDDQRSTYKLAWIHKQYGELITNNFKRVLAFCMFNNCVSISVEVSALRGRAETMFFPFAYLVGSEITEVEVAIFVDAVLQACKVQQCEYVMISNNYLMFAEILTTRFQAAKVMPDFFMVIEVLRESWLGKERGINDFDNAEDFHDYVEKVREALHCKLIKHGHPTVEKALESSLGVNYMEISNIDKIIEVSEDYLAKLASLDLGELEHEMLASKEDYALILEFLSKQSFEGKVKYLDNFSKIRGDYVSMMMPNLA